MEAVERDVESAAPRILVVDDEEGVRDLLVTVLKMNGEYEVHHACDGAAAKTAIENGSFDLVVTDLTMPNMTGLELMQWGHQYAPKLMWIILTGHGTFNDAVRAVQLGAFDFISKPLLTMDPLLISVRNALHIQRLDLEREQLHRDVEMGNVRLRQQVAHLKEACRMLCEQAEVIESDLRRAELIQRALLPCEAPKIEGLAVDTVYRPSLNVGGDLYDVVAIGPNHVAAYIADAAGHGVSAAMLAVLFKHRLAMMDHDYHPNAPAEALSMLNAAIRAECSAPGLFVTAAYCLLDTQSNEIVIASAGHPPLILRRADGSTEMIYHTGPALGLMADARFAEKRLAFIEGDRLLLYTDGLCDASRIDAALTSTEIAQRFSASDGMGKQILYDLLDEAQRRRGEPEQDDDITMCLLCAAKEDSCLDNGTPAPLTGGHGMLPDPKAEVLVGPYDDTAVFSIAGRGNWTYCAAFHDACVEQLAAGKALLLDLSLCMYLDSTFLGTIQDVADHAGEYNTSMRIQGVLPAVGAQFEELGMSRVIDSITPGMTPLPAAMAPLKASTESNVRNHAQILRAHRTLASLSETNRQEFFKLIEGLENELAQYEPCPDDTGAEAPESAETP